MLTKLDQYPDLKYIQSKQADLSLKYFPDFFILGPQRTGSTWLHENLRHHPQLMISEPKELYYFNCVKGEDEDCYYRSTTDPNFYDLADYLDKFRNTPRQFAKKTLRALVKQSRLYTPRQRGEASAHYALLPQDVIDEILTLKPDLRAVILIRNPIERAWSHAKKDLVRNAGNKLEDVPDQAFLDFFDHPYQRKCADYRAIIETWRAALKPGHLHIGFQKRIATDPAAQLREILDFLNLDQSDGVLNQNALTKRVNPTNSAAPPERFKAYLEKQFAEELAWLRETFGDQV